MNTGNAHYVTPKDRVTSEILKEMRSMSLPDLTYLRDQAQALNKARLEQEVALNARYPLATGADDHGE
ncbi:MAG: hypothetical protein ACHWZW_23020 [Spirulina sp.]